MIGLGSENNKGNDAVIWLFYSERGVAFKATKEKVTRG